MFDRPTFSAGAILLIRGVDIGGPFPESGASLNSDNIAYQRHGQLNLHFVAPINDQFG